MITAPVTRKVVFFQRYITLHPASGAGQLLSQADDTWGEEDIPLESMGSPTEDATGRLDGRCRQGPVTDRLVIQRMTEGACGGDTRLHLEPVQSTPMVHRKGTAPHHLRPHREGSLGFKVFVLS
ncbi:hypothetical protein NDU88_000341 [Pleurodeles waltl]|uniref:Uncharacterized protein n=1 Tax=Pleurodeles waltl TaxID=8319 RepID=A0AAV7WJ85_PLEWA|nr:hypothetical protein NDU88_000341 [Pleurodeles waltl]